MTDRTDAIQTAYEIRTTFEEEFENDFLEIDHLEHHYDHADEEAEVDVVVNCVDGTTRDGEVYGSVSTYAIHDFVEEQDLPLRVDREKVILGSEARNDYGTLCALRITFAVDV